MKYALAIIAGILLDALCGLPANASEPIKKPNILLIVADDLGYGDLSSYGATKIHTPNIDRLAKEGVRFTDAHSPAAICQPSRYGILSGTNFFRAQRQGKQTLYFHDGQVTLPGLLKSAGYRTAALGKWHLGFNRGADPDYNGELKPGPLEIGFDYFFGTPRTHNEPPFVFVENHRVFGFERDDPIRIVSHEQVLQRGLTDWGWGISEGATRAHQLRPQNRIDLILAEKAVEFLGQKTDQPLFLYLAFLAPHVPIAPVAEFQQTSSAGPYGDYVQQLDAVVGKVLDALGRHGLSENTLVIFTSDNGGILHLDALDAGHRANGALLGQKTDAWEGGHRVPFLARWPGRIPAGSLGNQLLGLTDIMATVAAAAGVALPADAAPDSLNQLPVLLDPVHAAPVRNELLLQAITRFALRQGEWLYIPQQGSLGFTVPALPKINSQYSMLRLATSDVDDRGRIRANVSPVQLFNLELDFFQRWNMAENYPQRAERLGLRLRELAPEPNSPVNVTPTTHIAPAR